MQRFLLLSLLIVGLLFSMLYYRRDAEKNRLKAEDYRQNINVLVSQLRKVYDDKIKLEQQARALEAAAFEDKNVFDWSADISNSAVIKRLQQQ